MLRACPPESRLCRVPGVAFCVTHEPDHPWVVRALARGDEVCDLDGRRIEWPPGTVADESGWPTHLRSNVDLVCFCDPGHDLIQDCPAPKPRPSTHP